MRECPLLLRFDCPLLQTPLMIGILGKMGLVKVQQVGVQGQLIIDLPTLLGKIVLGH